MIPSNDKETLDEHIKLYEAILQHMKKGETISAFVKRIDHVCSQISQMNWMRKPDAKDPETT